MKTKLPGFLLKPLGAALAVVLTLAFASCGGGGDKAISVTGVSLDKTSAMITVGDTETLVATVSPSNATNQTVSWASSNTSVATVSGGIVTAISVGTATITVATQDGGHKATCSVTAGVPVTGVLLQGSITLPIGAQEQLIYTITPDGATNKDVTWSSNNNGVASVNNSGLVTAQSLGTAAITVTTQDGGHTASCVVTVVATLVPGTPDTSWYNPSATTFMLTNADQLAGLAELVVNTDFAGKTIVLGNNIDLSAYAKGQGWTPIHNFTGNFNGNGKTIANLTINRPTASFTASFLGLFGGISFDGKVQNLGIENASISGNNYVGGIAGVVQMNGVVENCYSTGTISGNNMVGGIVGLVIDDSRVENCYSTGTISGNDYIGGIAGIVWRGSVVENCYSTGMVSGNDYIGGIAGVVRQGSVVDNCYSTSAVSGILRAGGIAGGVFYDNAAITGCAALNVSVIGNVGGGYDAWRVVGIEIEDDYGNSLLNNNIAWSGMLVNGRAFSGNPNDRNGANASAVAIRNGAAFQNMFADSVWTKQPGYLPGLFGQPTPIPGHLVDNEHKAGTPDTSWYDLTTTTFTLTSADQLAGLAVLVNNNLGHDNSFEGKTIVLGNNIDLAAYASGEGWTPMQIFDGTFNGNDKTISNLTINRPTGYNIGLFGTTYSGKVHNLGIVNASISGYHTVGGIVGVVGGGVVDNCYVTGTINGNEYVGGIAGSVGGNSSSVENCYSTAAISGNRVVGGIAGNVSNDSHVENCYSTGAVNSVEGYAGGIAGWVRIDGVVENCYSTGAISGGSAFIGGIAGVVSDGGVLDNCYATSAVSGAEYTGGIAGVVGHEGSVVKNCYSTGAVSGTYNVGGIAGFLDDDGFITGCAALNASITGQGNSIWRVAGNGYGSGIPSNNIAWSGMLVNGATVSGTANNQNGADVTAAAIQNGTAFNNMFTDSVWIKQSGYLPGLFGQPVPIPAHIK